MKSVSIALLLVCLGSCLGVSVCEGGVSGTLPSLPSDFTLASPAGRRASRASRSGGYHGAARGTSRACSKPEWTRLPAIASSPAVNQALSNDAMRAVHTCCLSASASMASMEAGPRPRRLWRTASLISKRCPKPSGRQRGVGVSERAARPPKRSRACGPTDQSGNG